MKGSAIVLCFFALGIAVGYFSPALPDIDFSECAMYVLYLLIAIVGFEFGYKNLKPAIRSLTLQTLLLPVFTIAGTLAATAAVSATLNDRPLSDYLAIGSGMGYYSLSSMLIIDCKTASVGTQIAIELATLALLTNLARELTALIGAPLFKKSFGRFAPISAAGVTSMDVALPVIANTCGERAIPLAIIHGVLLEITIPLLVTLFASL